MRFSGADSRLRSEVDVAHLAPVLAGVFTVGLLVATLTASGQPASKTYRVGYLTQGTLVAGAADRRILDAFRREATGDNARLPALATELVRLKPDVIVTIATPATEAVRQATSTIPIVGIALGDPLGSGLAQSLARPGGNVTGLSGMTPELAGKWLEVLKDALPALSRVVVLSYPDNPVHVRYGKEAGVAARGLGLTLEIVQASPSALEGSVPQGQGARTALLVLPEGRIFGQRARLAEWARQRHVPAISMFREFADAGFLIAYGPNLVDLWRRATGFVDRILRGALPGDLPIEQPVQFDFVVNLGTAKALGLTIPPAVLARASEVID